MTKKTLKAISLKIIDYAYYLLTKIRICKPTIIIRMDGGICSQMHQYLLGEVFHRKGMKVEYDLTFFKKDGKDINGIHARLFDLEKAFPYIKLKQATETKIKLYKKLYTHIGNYPKDCSTDWCSITAPKLLLGYYADPDYLYSQWFKEVFQFSSSILESDNLRLYNQIINQNSIAVHVRRGDLSTFVEAYGHPVTIEYFKTSINFFINQFENPHFYFFSDDLEYVSKELISNLPSNIKTHIVYNKPENGYIDLFLISQCKHQITSKGSLGKFGALLGMNKEKIVIVSKDDKQTFMLNNSPCTIISI